MLGHLRNYFEVIWNLKEKKKQFHNHLHTKHRTLPNPSSQKIVPIHQVLWNVPFFLSTEVRSFYSINIIKVNVSFSYMLWLPYCNNSEISSFLFHIFELCMLCAKNMIKSNTASYCFLHPVHFEFYTIYASAGWWIWICAMLSWHYAEKQLRNGCSRIIAVFHDLDLNYWRLEMSIQPEKSDVSGLSF